MRACADSSNTDGGPRRAPDRALRTKRMRAGRRRRRPHGARGERTAAAAPAGAAVGNRFPPVSARPGARSTASPHASSTPPRAHRHTRIPNLRERRNAPGGRGYRVGPTVVVRFCWLWRYSTAKLTGGGRYSSEATPLRPSLVEAGPGGHDVVLRTHPVRWSDFANCDSRARPANTARSLPRCPRSGSRRRWPTPGRRGRWGARRFPRPTALVVVGQRQALAAAVCSRSALPVTVSREDCTLTEARPRWLS